MYNKILLNAYLANNLGDDLFIRIICDRFKNITFYIVESDPYTDIFKTISNIRICSPKDILKNKFDLEIMIGGSLFMQPKDVHNIYAKYKSVTETRFFKNIPFIIIGANFGPYTEKEHYELYKNWFSTLQDICFRDSQSYSLFKKLPNVRWAPDVIFNYKLENNQQHFDKAISISCIYNNQRIGLHNYSQKNYFQALANASIYYIENGYNIKLASFCAHQDDLLAIYEIMKCIPSVYHSKIEILEYKGDNLNTFLSSFLNTEYIIGTRFHSIILGWLSNIPVFPIVYNIKMYNVIKCYGFEGNYANIEDMDKCNLSFINQNKKDNYCLDCADLIEKANSQFTFLEKLY